MKGTRATPAIIVILQILGFSAAAVAHHSTAMFDTTKFVSISGVITEMDWSNPHSLVFLDARPTDQPTAKVVNWSVVLPAPAGLTEIGWKKEAVKVGDTVTFTGCPRRDNRPQLLFVDVKDAKGDHFVASRVDCGPAKKS